VPVPRLLNISCNRERASTLCSTAATENVVFSAQEETEATEFGACRGIRDRDEERAGFSKGRIHTGLRGSLMITK